MSGIEEEEANLGISPEATGEKGPPRAAGWRTLMDVDLRVVAVKLTNRFRGSAREGEYVRVIKVRRYRAEEGRMRARYREKERERERVSERKRGGNGARGQRA